MKIDVVKIKNFRGYRDEVSIKFNDLTVLVGKNDIGKSTILEALDIFFNDGNGVIKIDKSDLNVEAVKKGDLETIISVIFTDLPKDIIIDSTVETSLQDEYMLNADGKLEIRKKYKNGGKANIFIYALHPTNPMCSDLLLKKNTELKKLIKDNEIPSENLIENKSMRKAIWSKFESELNLKDVEIDTTKEDAKKIWDNLSRYLPVYSLFQADRKNSDGDSEVQDPLKEAVKQILNDNALQKMLNDISQIVESKLKEVSSRTLSKLHEMSPTIANSLNPVIPTSDKLKWNDVFKSVSITGDEDISINKRGSGVKRLILLNFFRAEAERRMNELDGNGIIYAIEEPETSQHFEYQRILIKSLMDLAAIDNIQVLLTTHSPIIVKELSFSDLRMIIENGGKKNIVDVKQSVLAYPSLNEVIYSAYGEATIEYHDELFGHIEENRWRDEYKQGKQLVSYIRLKFDKKTGKYEPLDPENITLTEFIRHQIHHPENKNNRPYTLEELEESIKQMREFITMKQIL